MWKSKVACISPVKINYSFEEVIFTTILFSPTSKKKLCFSRQSVRLMNLQAACPLFPQFKNFEKRSILYVVIGQKGFFYTNYDELLKLKMSTVDAVTPRKKKKGNHTQLGWCNYEQWCNGEQLWPSCYIPFPFEAVFALISVKNLQFLYGEDCFRSSH